MEYSNQQPPEGINDPGARFVIKDFLVLLVAGIAAMLGVTVLVFHLGSWAGEWIPFAWEQKYFGDPFTPLEPTDPLLEKQQTVQALANKIAVTMDLPPEMAIFIHLVDEPAENAFATFGGHIILLTGLLDKLQSENALAFLLAHEIAHIKRRHVIRRVTAGVLLSLLYAVAMGGNVEVETWAGGTATLGVLAFSRDDEREADRDALAALQGLYRGVNGYNEIFLLFRRQEESALLKGSSYLSTHPGSTERLDILAKYAREQEWPATNSLRMLPAILR
ncbi:MAG: M48 family metallopeptidase [Magnetospiraceae bacterium]